MPYKYSICYPDKEEIEYKDNPISPEKALTIARDYPWLEQLELSESLDQKKVQYNPSLDFTCLDDDRSFCLTANYNDQKQLEFSLWYKRPKKVKMLFGLLGEKEEMVVDDVWSYDFDSAIKYFEYFVNKSYDMVEELYRK